MSEEKRSFNSVIIKECLTEAIILALIKRMREIHASVLPIYVDLFICIFFGGKLTPLIDDLTKVIANEFP